MGTTRHLHGRQRRAASRGGRRQAPARWRGKVELPGTKTEKAWRTVHLTRRGVDAIAAVPTALPTRRVFHIDGRPISWVYFWREVWRPALELAELEYRAPYKLRHTFAYFSLRAGVRIADVAREMGHEDVSRTYQIYGGWAAEMGQRAAQLRETWADATHTELARPETR